MIHTYEINGVPMQTGDIICTMNGKPDILPGEFWRLIGRLVPGDVDHIAVYLGPEGRCIESGAKGVVTFEVHNGVWRPEHVMPERGLLVDTFYGAAYPLDGLEFSEEDERLARQTVAQYCLSQLGKSYNLNFLNPETEEAFYCSQLAYKAYQRVGINLNTGMEMERLPGANVIVFPQEIWDGCAHRAVAV
ncbi:MAG: YiiX/YebB-like N1pC/P60 family cysteine hydrolase [Anaerolineales bacterium]|jgi:hypothetical protein|nr:YiiX/YebB-like N1pC/P60 family cysteine hydrolase [Anaerolineales bacterium]MDX9938239.1 YiiX/YebB-like N1pC/P60 family cysteine hydrolase [Anaerolineales bacterium]OQY82737.1 MAG: hypothetical protein B6D40_08360 [Anaerolineae bacterium UTCFX3]WKZ52296.1 MAG: YiiX/YebB-like N1pC/P60 family cysteine hydrolase [Anaerolineales bacterium]GER81290.1 conserved hypothetical protein [Candidatus Denitrolinea symbiosum]